ncbi:hypothetical protein LWI28_021112 [Acer negundo]|uniref:Plastocyanin-like domain-containing protein n=1 Tax=Acer negundo TaxID=4023 RepID=A0AAD5J6R0_ACENE|nr:hypothetical protein LWI28_021112 [Acer negundo]
MFFGIAQHNFTVVGTDGFYTKSINTNYIMITPRQTMDVLVTANQPASYYYMAASPFSDSEAAFDNATTTAIPQYIGNRSAPSPIPLPTLPENKWLSSLASDPPSELNVLGHDSDSLSVNGTQISVFKQTHQIRLSCLLKSSHYAALEPHIGLKILSNLSHKSLEWKLPYQKLCALLVLSYLSQRHRSGFETVRLLHSSGFRSRFPGSFGGQLLTWRFAYVGLPCRMLHVSHLENWTRKMCLFLEKI